MTPPHIHLTGAAGSGTTSLGRAVADRLGCISVDTDSVYWLPGDPPFQAKRPPEARMALLTSLLNGASEGWVLSGSLDGWGDPLIPAFDLVVFLTLPPAIRRLRLLAREHARYGARLAPGGAMHGAHRQFIAWADGYEAGDRPGRSLARHEAWLARLPCPVLRLSSEAAVDDLAAQVAAAWRKDAPVAETPDPAQNQAAVYRGGV